MTAIQESTQSDNESFSKAEADEIHQVLTFTLGDETYCVDISRIVEIVDRPERVTRLPNSPVHVQGIVDLRGSTTTVIDPKLALRIESAVGGNRILVIESETGDRVGWIVDTVEEVIDVTLESVETDLSNEAVIGVFKKEDQFQIWLDPDQLDC